MHPRIEQGFSLNGRVAMVTGAASGIGREAAVLFAQAGAQVVVADVDRAGLEQTAELIGPRATAVITDVARRSEVDALAAATLEHHQRIDVWANVAGILKQFDVVDVDETGLDQIIAVNMKGAYWGCAAAGKAMIEQGSGSIINISSNGGDSCPPGLSGYAMTKAAVNALTRSAARELGRHGIRVNTVAPGFVETPMASQRYVDDEGRLDETLWQQALMQRRAASPLGLGGEPSDIAFAMLYLASDASRFVTGQILRPNGGVFMA